MSAVLPDELKLIQPWLQRSKEIGEKEPIVSYFIKYYALQQALALASFTSKPFLFTLMDELEKVNSNSFVMIKLLSIRIRVYWIQYQFRMRMRIK